MKRCTRCQSYAINPSQHGRDGTRLDLCDVCFWRETAEIRAARIKRLEEAGNDMAKHAEALGMGGTGLVRRWKEAKP